MNLRSFWRINFDVVNVLEPGGTLKAEPRMSVEMVIWDAASRTRLGRSVTPIIPVPHGNVSCADGLAKFEDGYYTGRFHRTQLEDELLARISESLEAFDFGLNSEPVEDENISIVAQVRLLDDGQQEDRPLFYMGQPTIRGKLVDGQVPTDSVCLVEKIDASNGERIVKWWISGDYHETDRPFRIDDRPDSDPPRGLHRVRVIQDRDKSAYSYVYEILADAMPLIAPSLADPASHYFHGDPVDFYVGGMPDGSGGIIGLYGEISFLEFDPNNSCSNCAG